MHTGNANVVRGCSYGNFFTRKFIIRKFPDLWYVYHCCVPFPGSEVPVLELGLPTWIYVIIFLIILVVFVCTVFVAVISFLCYRRRHHCEVSKASHTTKLINSLPNVNHQYLEVIVCIPCGHAAGQ